MADESHLKALADAKDRWEKDSLKRVLDRYPERQEEFTTGSGLGVQRLYTESDLGDVDYLRDLGFPGEFPYTRGVQPTMYRGRLWTMRQYAGFGSARETNERFKFLLEQGQTGLSVAFDLPTQIGYDSDDPMSAGEVGKVGVAIDSLEDMEALFDGIPLQKVSTSMTINAPAAVLLAMYIAVGEKQGVPLSELSGTIQNDILKEYVARGTYIFPPQPSMRLITDVFDFCAREMPEWNTISISGYHIREAGSTAVQEVAFTLANAIAYVQAAVDAGLSVDDFAPRLSFFFNSHMDFFEEVAKFRAARRLWARIMKERFGARNSKSLLLRFHTQTAGCTLAAQQPENNVVRVTMQALAAVLGGTQSLHTNSRDEALALPTEGAVRVALRTQQIIAHESGVTNTIDPLAGSYFIETLTNDIERGALDYIEAIDRLGGAPAAIESGFVQREIQESAYRYQIDVEQGAQTVVGVNRFQVAEEYEGELLKVDPVVEGEQSSRIKLLRARRDGARVEEVLADLRRAAAGSDNLVPRIVACVRSYATLGEICDVLREEFGEYQAASMF